MTSSSRVLIVGGGIAGLTCAAALDARGFEVQVVERAEQWPAAGAGLSVQPNGLRALGTVSALRAAVERVARSIDRWVFADDQGAALCSIDLAGVWGQAGTPVGITRRDLQDALVSVVAQRVPCRLGVSVERIDERTDSVDVGFTDGASAQFDVVVGADGIRSVVRSLAFGPSEPIFAGHISWRAVAPVPMHAANIEFWLGDGRFFGMCPVAGGRTYGFGHVTRPKGRDPETGRLNRFRREFADFGPRVHDLLEALTDDRQIHCSAIEWVEQNRWHTRRVVLIGDAAHAASPLMGQGGSLALEDGVVLAEELDATPDVAEALAAYQRRRHERVAWVHEQSRRVADGLLQLPPAERNTALTEHGAADFRARYAPLTAPP